MKFNLSIRPHIHAKTLRRAGTALALMALGLPALAQDVDAGKALYVASFCSACHGDNPGANINNIRNGADNPAVFLAACASRDIKYQGMFQVCGEFSEAQAADIAAFIGSSESAAPAAPEDQGGCSLVQSKSAAFDPVLLSLLVGALVVLRRRRR